MKQTRIKQLLGSRSLCRHKAIWSHYLCILKQLTLLPVLLLSFYVQKKKKSRHVLLNLRIPLSQATSNVTFSEQRLRKGTREVTEKSGGREELFLQPSALIRIQHRHSEANLWWISLCFLPRLWHKTCRFPAGNRRWTVPSALSHSITETKPGLCWFVSRFVF